MKKETCFLISGGTYADLPEDLPKEGYVIACDRGWEHARRLGLEPDRIVGDFDSSPRPEGASVPVDTFPSRKDDTDTMLAARLAADMGFTDVVIACSFGGRLDHTVANLQTAAFLAERGMRVRLCGADTDAWVLRGETDPAAELVLPRREGRSLSVFSMTDRCEGVSIRGASYECEEETLTNGFPLGVSNVWAAGEVRISVKSGVLLVIESALQAGEHI